MDDIDQDSQDEIEVSSVTESKFEASKLNTDLVGYEIFRLTATVPHAWHGVSGCCDEQRKLDEISGRFAQWRDEQIQANPTLAVHDARWDTAEVHCRKRGAVMGGTRKCSASTNIPCWIEFLKPKIS